MFTLTENHIKLVRSFYIDFDTRAYDGAPCVNIKRPYGNSDVMRDVYEILYGTLDDEVVDDNTIKHLKQLHEETATALQIILCTGSFQPGTYALECKYDSLSWRLVE